MTDNLYSPKMFFRDFLINFISGLIVGTIIGVYSGEIWLGLMSFITIVIVVFFFWLWHKYRRMIKLILSGNAGYYFSFDLEENPKVWNEAKHSFCYLGISFDSIKEPFMRWIEKQSLSRYRILLMKPYSDSLKRQEAFRRGNSLDIKIDELSPEARQDIDEAVNATSKRIEGAISILKNTVPYRQGRLEIKLYDEFTPWWIYVLDENIAYIGIMEKGKPGYDSPVVIMKKNETYTSPFDAFKNNWERIWQNATKV